MKSVPKIKQTPAPSLHPTGIFACQIIDFGEIRQSASGKAWLMSVTLKTSEGQLYTSFAGFPDALMAIKAATPYYASRVWQVKVSHTKFDDRTYNDARILWNKGSTDVSK